MVYTCEKCLYTFLEDEGWERGELHYMTFYII